MESLEPDEEAIAQEPPVNIITFEDYEHDGELHEADVQQVEDNNTLVLVSKTKYYKQTYRRAWESMPDFKGWLHGVPGQPTRAYCLYCQKTLHAHRLSLLKHTCTIRHQKAAQIHQIRNKKHQGPEEVIMSSVNVLPEDAQAMDEAIIEYDASHSDMNDQDEEYEQEEEEEEGDDEPEYVELDKLPVHVVQKKFLSQMANQSSQSQGKSPISTHILDTSKGSAVGGLQVSLYKLVEGRWTYINEGVTNADGRLANFIERTDFTPGRYKLHYDVDRYFETKKQETLYPFIEIVFDCRMPNDHYHVPLLLSPFGYTTYRGT